MLEAISSYRYCVKGAHSYISIHLAARQKKKKAFLIIMGAIRIVKIKYGKEIYLTA
ncbi:MAG: hypothetical protein ACUBOA_06120 [Candidatus Loosdrechtia sp.]|uniref:hypothetical protein n=1 Tax=Candidatus Loosdrechtia sp. TaxID=3101272 RepID=UPI003A606476|nr:MAG: hypothetical protein QY305_09155 [Candidatus Jettenia sp. AMX2]